SLLAILPPPQPTLFPYTTLFRSTPSRSYRPCRDRDGATNVRACSRRSRQNVRHGHPSRPQSELVGRLRPGSSTVAARDPGAQSAAGRSAVPIDEIPVPCLPPSTESEHNAPRSVDKEGLWWAGGWRRSGL